MNPAQSSRIFNPVGLQTWFRRITNHAGTRTDHLGYWSANRMRTAGEGGYSPVFASRAAVPHPVHFSRPQCRIRWQSIAVLHRHVSRLRCFWQAATRFALSPHQCLAARSQHNCHFGW